MVEGHDNNSAERHSKDAEGIVLFTGLFSAALAALITVTIQDLKPPPGAPDDLPFSPPTYAIWVNSLWISSLVISIKSALLATLIQQWTRRSLRLTQPSGGAHKRARIRQHISEGASDFHFLLLADAVPTLLHLSVFLFFTGLLILLWHINHAVFDAVVVWVLFCFLAYGSIAFLPFYRPVNPHYAPITSLIWQLYAGILYPTFISPVKRGIFNMDVRPPAVRFLDRLEEKIEADVLDKSPDIDADILEKLLDNLGEDGARETFFEAIPDFYESKVVHVDDVQKKLSPMFFTKFRLTVNQFVDQTLSSDSVSELARSRRLLACLDATHSVLGDRAGASITDKIIRRRDWNEMPPSPEIGHILRRWRNSTKSSLALTGSCIIAKIIANVKKRDDTWMALARSQLGVSEEVLAGYLEHGDSVLLSNLIKTTRLYFENGLQFRDLLPSISKFNVEGTLPELQRDFCTLWNEIVEKSRHSIDCFFILGEIRHVHAALHPTSPTTVAALPTSTTSNNNSLLLGHSYALCADPQSPHHPHDASRQIAAVASSSSFPPLGVQPPSPPLQRGEININPHLALDTPSYSYSTATSHTLATPRDSSFSDPGVIVVTADERDAQDLNAHNPYQSDTPARDSFMTTSRPGKSLV